MMRILCLSPQAQLSDEQSSSAVLPERARREAKLFEANLQREIDAERRACREQEERLLQEVEERCLSVRRLGHRGKPLEWCTRASRTLRARRSALRQPLTSGLCSPQVRLELARAKKLREEAEERVAGESAGQHPSNSQTHAAVE